MARAGGEKVENRKERDHPESLGIEREDDINTDISYVGWKGWGSGGSCEHSNGPPGSTKHDELSDQLGKSELLHKECATWTD